MVVFDTTPLFRALSLITKSEVIKNQQMIDDRSHVL